MNEEEYQARREADTKEFIYFLIGFGILMPLTWVAINLVIAAPAVLVAVIIEALL